MHYGLRLLNRKGEGDNPTPSLEIKTSVESDDYAYLKAAVALKEEKVKENNSAIITEVLSDAQTAVAAFVVVKQALFAFSLAPVASGLLPIVMLGAAVPAVLSLVSEIKKDKKDLRVLQAMKDRYEETQDEDLLKEGRIFIKIHAPHTDIDEEMAAKGPIRRKMPVKLQYRNIHPTIRTIIEKREKDEVAFSLKDVFKKSNFEDITGKLKWALKSVFNSYALSLKLCTIDLAKTYASVSKGLSETWRVARKDRKSLFSNIMTPTLYESLVHLKEKKENAHGDFGEIEAESPIFNQDSKLHIRRLHTIQLAMRNNAKQRGVTAVGTAAVASFVTLALLQSAVNFAAGNVVQGTSYLMMSALLSVPSLKVLSDRLTELSENERDHDIRLATKMAKHGL
jgi:hypothetical protein